MIFFQSSSSHYVVASSGKLVNKIRSLVITGDAWRLKSLIDLILYITLMMVLIRTTNTSFGEIINKYQDGNIKKKNVSTLERKEFQNNKDSI